MYSIELTTSDEPAIRWFDTAEEAMAVVNLLRGLHIEGFIIRDVLDAVLTDQQLAMIVMEDRLQLGRPRPNRS